jgi:hypothetical protein
MYNVDESSKGFQTDLKWKCFQDDDDDDYKEIKSCTEFHENLI